MSKLRTHIGVRMATILVVSIIVGSGVFKKIAPMAAILGSPLWVIACWLLAGLISLAGALSNAEMGGMVPDSGGELAYYQRVYGRFFAFLYGWGNFTVLKSAGISAIAYVFAQSFNSLLPMPTFEASFVVFGIDFLENFGVKTIASLLIIGLSYLNYRGLTFAEALNEYITHVMIAFMLVFVGWGLFFSDGSWQNLTSDSQTIAPLQGFALVKALFVASLGAFWGYEGWNHVGYLGEEIQNPQRNLPLALGYGTGFTILLYLCLNLTFCYVLPIDAFVQLNQNPNAIAAVEVANHLWQGYGGMAVAVVMLLTTLGATNGSILSAARIYYAMARDGFFFKVAARVHPQYHTPSVSLAMQGAWSVALIWSGSFDQLTDMLIFAAFIFYGSTAFAVILLRIKQPNLHRPYRVIGYPLVPALFCVFCLTLFIITLINQPAEALMGLGLIASGIPFYVWWAYKTQ